MTFLVVAFWWTLAYLLCHLTVFDGPEKPVKFDDPGVALVSGFGASITEHVLTADKLDPLYIVLETLNSGRYEPVVV